ncbi:hypothetical protein [Klebsiella aerogenes]|uniref:hypothetical protein n=1 Tax=Klebsiella aerogenes TaxID=548 RepID=UPI001F2620EE|nr:hypothetical protein [Klebsiella aerogenes]
MGITYADLCHVYRQSLKQIEQDEAYLKEEFLRFQHACIESLSIPEPDDQERREAGTCGVGEKPRVEFIVADDCASDSAPAGLMARKCQFDILIHISVDPGHSGTDAVFRKSVVLQHRPDAFIYFVDFRQFTVMKKPDAAQYKPLCTYLKDAFYNLCRCVYFS